MIHYQGQDVSQCPSLNLIKSWRDGFNIKSKNIQYSTSVQLFWWCVTNPLTLKHQRPNKVRFQGLYAAGYRCLKTCSLTNWLIAQTQDFPWSPHRSDLTSSDFLYGYFKSKVYSHNRIRAKGEYEIVEMSLFIIII